MNVRSAATNDAVVITIRHTAQLYRQERLHMPAREIATVKTASTFPASVLVRIDVALTLPSRRGVGRELRLPAAPSCEPRQ